MYIMLKDEPVLYFDFDDMLAEVITPKLMPISLRDKILPLPNGNAVEIARVMASNIEIIKDWMSDRVLSLSRDNAKQIFNMFNISQSNDKGTRVKICLLCRGVSISDSYWIKFEKDEKAWEQVNVRNNHFKEIVDIALNGENPSITTNLICPELTTKGLFRKAWIRDKTTKELYLLKSDKTADNINTHMEVLASHILDCFVNVPHIQYTGRIRTISTGKIYVDKCKNFVDNDFSFVEAREVMEYCRYHNSSFEEWALSKFGGKFANIAVVDYLISNTDRHDNNYGFMMNNVTGELVDIAPLFDYNLALVADAFGKDVSDTLSQMLNNKETVKGLADRMLPYSDIEIDYEKLKNIKKYFKEYIFVYDSVVKRINDFMQQNV